MSTGWVSVEEVAKYVATCPKGKEHMDQLLQMVSRCKNRNNLTLFDGKVGLYYNESAEDPQTYYECKVGGTPATIVHYAAVRGRGDILSVLDKAGVNLHISCRDNHDHIVTPLQVAIINLHQDSFVIEQPARTSAEVCNVM